MKVLENKPDYGKLSRHLLPIVWANSKPRSRHIHLIPSGSTTRLLVVNGSKFYDISEELTSKFESFLSEKDENSILALLQECGFLEPAYINDQPLKSPQLKSLSLAIAQKCNLGCAYCYAGQGEFGGPMKNMDLNTTLKAVDLLLKDCRVGERVLLTFIGGEPLLNRAMIRVATDYAKKQATLKGVNIGFSITSNGTLMTADDAVFFEENAFSVTISLDGGKQDHDKLRPFKGGKGSFDQIIDRIKPLLDIQQKMQVSARVTVTSQNLDIADTLDAFLDLGFHSVGFSPLLNSSSGSGEMDESTLHYMLGEMIECGLKFETKVLNGQQYPFLNMLTAFQELSKQTHRPYPCGAGAGYMGVSADGELAACHRFVNEPKGKVGSLSEGIDVKLQNDWLSDRHVHTQNPCQTCWARYLCAGGCHHEVMEKGRSSCDYIRSWLHYTIQAQTRLHSSINNY